MYRFNHLVLMDDHQKISVMNVGEYEIDNTYRHISFYPILEGVLSLSGFLYPLQSRRIHMKKYIQQAILWLKIKALFV